MLSFLNNLFSAEKADFAGLIAQGALVIDVRSPQEFARGHAKGSMNIPVEEISNHLQEIKQQNIPVITCCRSGTRANNANAVLRKAEIEVYNAGSWKTIAALI